MKSYEAAPHLLLLLLLLGGARAPAPRDGQTPQREQLNPGVVYRVANTEGQFYMGGEGQEYFDVYTPPIRTRYSEVYWTTMPPVPLPVEMVRKYDGRVMALTGHEVNVIRRHGNGSETDVPCYDSYNHHFVASLRSKHVELVATPEHDASVLHHTHTDGQGNKLQYRLRGGLAEQILQGVPTSTETQNPNNGNEHRQSYHQLPQGLVKLIQSPSAFDFTPMQINTRGPSGRGTGPLPRSATATATVGIMECPCTTRIKKEVLDLWDLSNEARCPGVAPATAITSLSECRAAAAGLGLPIVANITAATEQQGGGCFVTADLLKRGFQLHFNPNASLSCGAKPADKKGGVHLFGSTRAWEDGQTLHELSLEIVAGGGGAAAADTDDVTVPTNPQVAASLCNFTQGIDFAGVHGYPIPHIPSREICCQACVSYAKRKCLAAIWGGAKDPVCVLKFNLSQPVKAKQPSFVGCVPSAPHIPVPVPSTDGSIKITITGNASCWLGVAFGKDKMDGAYAIIIEPSNGSVSVTERKLGDHAAGVLLQPSVVLLSDTVQAGTRTVVLQRELVGVSPDHFTFSAAAAAVPTLTARGGSPHFSQHVARSGGTVLMASAAHGARTCLCKGKGAAAPFGEGVGKINGVVYSPGCKKPPLTSLIEQKNPSCDVRTYVGGMQCCRHQTILLDADQEPPPYVDEVFFKWRFYVREFRPATDRAIIDLTWYISAADHSIEYDAPAAKFGEIAEHVITSNFTGLDFIQRSHDVDLNRAQSGIHFVQMGGHCHSPACLSLELFNADTGQLICRISPVAGTSQEPMDEQGYLYLPPCMWSQNAVDGLPSPPVFFPNTNFSAIKRVNNTVYHYGIMAIFQSTGVYVK
eukprot:COSAG01_NODE_40_length_32708_cov_25.641234_5_plen_866_part_00